MHTHAHRPTYTHIPFSSILNSFIFSAYWSVCSSKSRALMEDYSLSQGATTERVTLLITTTQKAESGDNHRDLQWLDSEDGCSQASHRTVDRTRSIHSWIQLTAHNRARLDRVLPNHCNYLSCCHQRNCSTDTHAHTRTDMWIQISSISLARVAVCIYLKIYLCRYYQCDWFVWYIK